MIKTQPRSGVIIILLLTILQQSLAAVQGGKGGSAQGGPGGKITGKIKEQNGKNLEGVIVRASQAKNSSGKHEARSDSSGSFTLNDLPPGEYSLSFDKPGYKTFTTRKLEVTADETLKLSRVVELVREGTPYSVIRGAVFYGVGYSLANAIVLIERIDGGKKLKEETISQEGGEFAFRLKAERAKYRLTARARGFLPASTEIEIENDEVRSVALTLQPEK
ncbi:MAG TPA: carboxypeptidase-like regulatory domain-containing protein [Blastocatellia bacterium]|nr:carboxypeptidase-like regulatory domain-containing protein [Blastocatellia bacterium]